MEVLIVSGILAVGYFFNKKHDENENKQLLRLNLQPDSDTAQQELENQNLQRSILHDGIRDFNEQNIKRFRDSFFPQQSGIIAPQYTQRNGFNPGQAQRTHDSHIGRDATYVHKKEGEPALFEPRKQTIDSSGREGNTEYNSDTDRFASTLTRTHQNTLPFEQIRVGHGIATDEDANDGFHYGTNRVLPVDPYSHKSKEMSGNIPTTGGALISKRTIEPSVQQNRPSRVWSQGFDDTSRVKFVPQKAMRAEAQMGRGEFSGLHTPCKPSEFYLGNATRPGAANPTSKSTRIDDRTSSVALTNVTGIKGFSLRPNIDIDMSGQSRGQNGTLIGLGYRNSARSLAPMSAPIETNRDVSNRTSTTVVAGPAAPAVFKQERDYCSDKQLLREAKRATYRQDTYVPGADAGRATAYRNAMLGFDVNPYVQQQYKLKSQCHKPRLFDSHANSHASKQMMGTEHLGKAGGNTKKLTGEIPRRNDFNLGIPEQLQQNPFHIR